MYRANPSSGAANTRFATVAVLFSLGCMALSCQSIPFETERCPSVSYGTGTLFAVGAPLRLDGEPVRGELGSWQTSSTLRFSAHPVAVPPAGGLTLTIRVDFDGPVDPALYLYGPRGARGLYGTCIESSFSAIASAAVETNIATDLGGEYLLLVGAQSALSEARSYAVQVTCGGDSCGDASCPVRFGTCDTEVCPAGFELASVIADSQTVLECQTCECLEPQCDGFHRRVFDACECACDLHSTPGGVCGRDGASYAAECLAACAGVGVVSVEGPCEVVCPPLNGCALQCDTGYALVDGCPVCACSDDPCRGASQRLQPVCGTDGLTYTNVDQLRCRNAETPAEVAVAYLGHCLPYCELPECELSCAFGLRPSLDAPPDCFECECQQADLGCDASPGFVCARPSASMLERLTVPNSAAERQARVRTFVDDCMAHEMDWAPTEYYACPSALCDTEEDCAGANSLLVEGLTLLASLPPEATIDVTCRGDLKSGGGAVGRCMAQLPRACAQDADCLPGQQCLDLGDGSGCRFSCNCLNTAAGATYDPICGEVGGKTRTYFNHCFAYCHGASIEYPGECCEPRLSATERAENEEALDAFCAGLGEGYSTRAWVTGACPPTPEVCASTGGSSSACCRAPEGGAP